MTWCYIGKSIPRVIQTGTIWTGEKSAVLARPEVAAAVEKYPLIARLIVSGERLQEARQLVKTEGTLFYRWNRDLMK